MTKELYPTPVEKATALIESIISNHPFIDGNKRFGYVAMRLLIINFGMDIKADENSKYNFVIGIANGELNFEGIKHWLNNHIIR